MPELMFLLNLTNQFIKKESLAQVIFSEEFCEISKNTFFYRTPPIVASNCVLICICYCYSQKDFNSS